MEGSSKALRRSAISVEIGERRGNSGRVKRSTFYTEGDSPCETLRPEEFAGMKEFKESRSEFTLSLILGGKTDVA